MSVEFVIVVVGVFMGLQVQYWNDARKERIDEHDLLSRHYEETLGLLDAQREELVGLRARADVLMGVNSARFSQEPPRVISGKECENISSSHVFRRPPDELPVLDEILSTRRFDVLRDEVIKEQLRSYWLFHGRGRAYSEEATNDLFRLHSRFPDLITVGRVPMEAGFAGHWTGLSGEGFRWNLVCDVEKMRASTAFLNEYVDNLHRDRSMITFAERRLEHLDELRTTLSSRLGISAIARTQE